MEIETVKSDVGMNINFVSLKNVIDKPLSGEWGDGEGETNVIRTTNFTNDGKLDLTNVVKRNVDNKKIIQKQLLYGDTIIEKSGGSPSQPVGRVVYFDQNEGVYLCNNFTSVIRGKSNIDKRYLFWFLFNNHLTQNTLRYQNKTTGIINLQLERYIDDLQIPLPPLPIQRRIAEILDAADALRRKDQQLLKKYDELAQAIFIDMFGDPVKNEKGWEVKRLGELFSKPVKCGPFGSALKKEEYVKHGIPVWIMDNIQDYNFSEAGCLYISDNKYSDLTTYSAANGDIIISRAGTVGKMCVIDSKSEKSIISTNLIKVTLNDKLLNPYYFVRLMKYFGKKIGRLRTGSEDGFTHMNTGVLAGLEFPLPGIEKQHDYLNILKNINNQICFLNTNPEELFQTLLQKAFKGELITE